MPRRGVAGLITASPHRVSSTLMPTEEGPIVHARSARRERGHATTALIIVFSLFLLGFGFLYVSRLAKVGDEAAGLQTAADAAALAGAQSIVKEMPDAILAAIEHRSILPGGMGQAAASEFALRNDASLVSYRYYPAAEKIEVTVRSRKPLETGHYEYAKATSRVGVRIGACTVPPKPTPPPPPPPPSPEPTPTPTPSPAPPKPWKTVATCGELSVPVTMPPSGTGRPTLDVTEEALKAWFAPALRI